jgi:hypothetical protein
MTEHSGNTNQTPPTSSEPGSSADRLDAAVASASDRHTRLVLVVGTPDSDISVALHQLAAKSGCSVVNVGLELARTLLEVPQRRRPVAAADAAADIFRGDTPDGLQFLDHIEVLFQPELRLDPLKIMQDAARNRVVVGVWPGEWTGTSLRYAVPSHAEFREYENPDCLVVEAPSSSTKDRS